jgi:hypothetical protein
MMQLDTPNHNVLPVLPVTGVTALADAIPGMRALSFLDISSNDICKKIVGPKKVDIKASEGDIVEFNGIQGALATWNDTYFGFVPLSGIQAVATAIKDMGALIKLDISRNCIGAAQEEELQRICLASGIELAK